MHEGIRTVMGIESGTIEKIEDRWKPGGFHGGRDWMVLQ